MSEVRMGQRVRLEAGEKVGMTWGKGGGGVEVRNGVKGGLAGGCWQEVPEWESRWWSGVRTFQSKRMISPRSSSPALTATSTSHSSISAGSSSSSSESMSTENWRMREGAQSCVSSLTDAPRSPSLPQTPAVWPMTSRGHSGTRESPCLPIAGGRVLPPPSSGFPEVQTCPVKDQPQIWEAAWNRGL